MDFSDRDNQGRFTKGNKAGKGRPIGSRVDMLRRSLIESVTAEDIRMIIQSVIGQAKNGDLNAAKLVLTQVLGNPANMDIIERQGLQTIEAVEEKERKDAEFSEMFKGFI